MNSMSNNRVYRNVQDNSLQIAGPISLDSGLYTCRASNGIDSSEMSATLRVQVGILSFVHLWSCHPLILLAPVVVHVWNCLPLVLSSLILSFSIVVFLWYWPPLVLSFFGIVFLWYCLSLVLSFLLVLSSSIAVFPWYCLSFGIVFPLILSFLWYCFPMVLSPLILFTSTSSVVSLFGTAYSHTTHYHYLVCIVCDGLVV